jgi:hypothetical protein
MGVGHMFVYEIPAENLDKLTERFEKMVNRSKKCRTIAPTFTVIHEAEEVSTAKDSDVATVNRFLYITIDGILPKVKDWQFIATIDHTNDTGNIIRGVPGMGDIPVSFRKAAPSCQHCGHTRQRHETFVLRKGTEYKQVGRNCLADFFDGELADYVVPLTELWESLGEMISGMGDSYGNQPSFFSSADVLTLTQEVIIECGWLSATKRREILETDDRAPETTAYLVGSLLAPPVTRSTYIVELWSKINANRANRSEEENASLDTLSETALEWARSLDPEAETTNDYLYNLHTISKAESVSYKGLGLLCSLIPAYRRVTEVQKERESKPVSSHVGIIGGRQVFENVTVEWVGQATYSQWGATTPVKFVDSTGNVLMLWCSGSANEYEVGKILSIVGTVKSHDIYRNVNQTVINRVKLWDGKPVKQAKPKKK